MNLATKTLLAILLGIVTGLGLSIYLPDVYEILNSYIFGPVGELFIKAIKMVVVLLVFSAIVASIASAGDPKRLGQMGLTTIAWFVVTTIIACSIGILTAIAIGPGENITLPDTAPVSESHSSADTEEAPTLKETLLDIIPSNPIEAMATGNMLQVLVFSLLFGIALAMLGEKGQSMLRMITELNEVMMKLVQIFMKVIPYAAFALVATSMGAAGLDLIGSMVKYLLAILVGLTVYVVFTYGTMITFFSNLTPVQFLRNMVPAIGTAFATSSSAASLPITKSCCEDGLKLSKEVSSFVLPLGMTMNMNGASLSHGVAAVFVAQLNGIELGFMQYITIVFISLLASVGAPAIPGGGIVSLSMIFLAVGLPIEGVGIAIILGLFRLVDMPLTSVNVLGDAVCASVIDKRLNPANHVFKRKIV